MAAAVAQLAAVQQEQHRGGPLLPGFAIAAWGASSGGGICGGASAQQRSSGGSSNNISDSCSGTVGSSAAAAAQGRPHAAQALPLRLRGQASVVASAVVHWRSSAAASSIAVERQWQQQQWQRQLQWHSRQQCSGSGTGAAPCGSGFTLAAWAFRPRGLGFALAA